MKSNVPFYQIFWCFTYYDKLLKQKRRFNCNDKKATYNYRSLYAKDVERYSCVSLVFESSLEVGAV